MGNLSFSYMAPARWLLSCGPRDCGLQPAIMVSKINVRHINKVRQLDVAWRVDVMHNTASKASQFHHAGSKGCSQNEPLNEGKAMSLRRLEQMCNIQQNGRSRVTVDRKINCPVFPQFPTAAAAAASAAASVHGYINIHINI